MSTPEGRIKRKIFEYLENRPDVKDFWNQKSMGTFSITGYRKRGKYDKVGISDILGFLKNGQMFGLEVKDIKGKASEAQLDFIKLLNDLGHIGGIVRSVEDAENVINNGIKQVKRGKINFYKRH